MKHLLWIIPLALMALITPWISSWDLALSNHFYQGGHFVKNGVTEFYFKYGRQFGFLLGGVALIAFALSWMLPKWQKWRKGALAIILTGVIGCGVIVDFALKEGWGRPRPKHTTEFGGQIPYRPFYSPDFGAQDQKSFPSGHVAAGFYYLSLCFAAYRYKNLPLFIIGVAMILLVGIPMIVVRIAMGAHFLSDTLVSIVVMWLTSLFFTWLCFDYLPNTKAFRKWI